ncbi:MAG TPA: dienelactone hydrolase family protein [Burkholderiales bacterium]|nr:dienelactone hydrolase family protein [Burkholderiales bacterium]
MTTIEQERVEWSRRDFMLSLLATGFVAAAEPVLANAIHTDVKGLSAGEVELATADRPIPAYHAMPATGGPFPIVLVVQEIFGVHEHIRDICRRLAKLGYLAIAPELFIRQGNVAGMTDIQQIMREVVSKVPDAQVMSDLDAALSWATTLGKGDAARVGITGFCYGGRITWLYCAHNPSLKAGVAWYGRLVGQSSALNPQHPIDITARLTVPVLGLYGGADAGIPPDTVEQMRAALAKGKSGSEIHVYPDAPHAFFADYRASYRKEAAEDGWRRMLEWFKAHGVKGVEVAGRAQ